MRNFKLGDIVKGNNFSDGKYLVTDSRMKQGKVVKIHDNGLIDIRVLKHEDKNYEGAEFVKLIPQYFELAKESIEENLFLPKHYIINKNATILMWKDGTKTVVKKCEEDEFNPRLGFLTAIFQHYCGMSKNKANKYLANLQIEEENTNKEEK